MNTQHFCSRFGVAALAGVIGASTAQAQESTSVLDEVIVTAQKREEKLQDVPIAITVVGEKQLADQHVYSIADLSRTTPALEMVQAFGGPGGGGQIRGIGTTSMTRSAEGAVGIVVDGVPQGNVNISNIFDMQRVEVLRGPQGTLFGLTSSAGVINMVTVAPDPSSFAGKVHVDYSDKGTAGSKFGEQTVRGVVNLPTSADSALRISVSGDRVDGVQRNSFTNTDNVSKDYSVRARYLLKSSDNFTMNLIADYDKRDQNYNDPQFTYVSANPQVTAELKACGITPSYANQSRCASQANNFASKNYGASAQFDIGLGDLTLTSISAYRKNKADPNDNDIMAIASEFQQIFNVGLTGSARQFSQELRVASPSNQTVEYVAGLFYADAHSESGFTPTGGFRTGTFQLAPFFIPFFQNNASTETSNKSTAAFGQMTWHATDQLGVIAGLRFTHQKITDMSSANTANAFPVPATSGVISKDNVSGRLGLQYKFSPETTGYVTAVRGYKGPQVTPAVAGTPATVIDAEIPTAYEVGLKGSLGPLLGYDANVFLTKVKDYQGQRCALNAQGVLNCVGESVPSVTTKGAEFDLFGRPLTGLSFNAGIIYNIAKYPTGWTGYNPNILIATPNVSNTTNLGDQQLVGVPKTKFTFSAEYVVPVGGVEGFIGGDTVYKSDMRLGPSGDPRFVYPSHWIHGARLGVRAMDQRWSASLFARNLGNEHEPITIFAGPAYTAPTPSAPNGFTNGISGWMTAAALRQVGLSVDVKF